MIILNSTSDLVQVITGSGVSSILVHSSWVDFSAGVTAAPNRTNTPAIVAATTTTIVASPASSTQRNVKTISIFNSSASPCLITVNHTDGSNVITLFKYNLQAGETAMYYEGAASGSAWVVMDANGGLKVSPTTGRLLKRSVVTGGTTFTTTLATTSFKVFLQGGGGGGGGNPATASTAGSGGSAGGYAEKYFTGVVGNTTYTIQIGAAGAGASGANGTAGTSTLITVGATTVTANGGNFGLLAVAATSVAGGASPAVSTNGDLNSGGEPGEEGVSSATSLVGGSGGGCNYGAGGGTSTTNATTGKAAIGFGAGGGGSSTLATAGALAGGAGAAGVMVIEEYA
jgi:hypothetical protein